MSIGQKSLGFFTQKRLCNRIEDICGQSLRDDHQSARIERRDFCFVVTCASRNFSATEEGKGTIPLSNSGMSWFRNPGQIGGQVYADLDMLYQYNDQVYFGLSIK